jgi:3-oxoacyl-(acyl-carrier-protein) synthase
MMGAAGAISALAAVLAMHEGVIPPTINHDHPDPQCDLDYVPNLPRRAQTNATIVNAFGFGGQNVTLVMKRYTG